MAQQIGDPTGGAAGVAEHQSVGDARGEGARGREFSQVAERVGVPSGGVVVEAATVQLDDDAVLLVPDVLNGGCAGRRTPALPGRARQPVGPLDPVQVPALQDRTGAVGALSVIGAN